MKRIILFSLLCLLVFSLLYRVSRSTITAPASNAMDEGGGRRVQWEMKMLQDPATGKIPAHMRSRELAFAQTLPQQTGQFKTNADPFWQSVGPWNVGGRTRAVAVDKTNENILLAGAASGGIWRSTDGGLTWTRTTQPNQFANVTCLLQDSRAGKTNTWYAATGEYYGGYVPGASYLGEGMLKSTDGGLSWTRIASTYSGTPQFFDNNWDFIHNIALSTADTGTVLYAATYDGIYKSSNGGTSWVRRRGGNSVNGNSNWTDLAVTSTGVVYATLSSNGAQKGIWRSTDGINWVNILPAEFPQTYGRLVIGLCPSDENQMYFVAPTPGAGKKLTDFRGREEWVSLWKYTYLSGDGKGSGGKWEDRSQNVPALGGDFGNFNTQQGYCLDIKVKPDNPDVVFLSGTNLYRSTDGFSSSTKTKWIGGYEVNTKRPDFKLYANHHPDVHRVFFYPSNLSRILSVHDGGLSRTENSLANVVSWESLNRGYNTTQFYTVALDPNTSSDRVIGGLQDNGTQFNRNINAGTGWNMCFNSDGAFCFVNPVDNDYYVSAQEGRVWRIKLDATDQPVQLARLDPLGGRRDKYQFINPFVSDPNDWKRLYIPAGDRVWRNNDISLIPLKTSYDTNRVSTNWDMLSNTVDTADEITAIACSKNPSDIVVYGTQVGKLYKLQNASSGNPQRIDIRGNNMPVAYINCIAIHPTDANKMIVVFTNYNVRSIFYTEDGGSNWSSISGNLEQNPDGSGNGPSCRWATIVPVNGSYIYFMGTTVGLFATDLLNGDSTKWIQQGPAEIGNNIVTMMDIRPADGRMVVSTYGAGVFAARINSAHNITSAKKNEVITVKAWPNPFREELRLQHNLKGTYEVQVSDALGRECYKKVHHGGNISLPAGNWLPGVYYCRLSQGTASKVISVLKN